MVQCSDGQVKESSDFRASFLYHNGNEAYVGSYPVGQPTRDTTGFTCHRKTITDVQIFSGDVYGEPVIPSLATTKVIVFSWHFIILFTGL